MRRRYAIPLTAAAAYAAARTWMCLTRRFDFRHRVVVITGGSRGLGLVMARQLADAGARLALCARDGRELARAVAELSGRAREVVGETCDVTDAQDSARFFAHVQQMLGPVDVLINNAGLIQVGPLESMTGVDFARAMQLHFWAPLRAIAAVLPAMRRRKSGRIVNISSFGGLVSVPHLLPYCASKHALVGLSDGLRAELAPEGIYVTTVCPGVMRTGSPRHAVFKGRHREEFTWFSLGAGTPGFSIGAERAASQILRACRYGQARCTPGLPAKLAAAVQELAPELAAEAAALAARLLPRPGGIEREGRTGAESASPWSPSWLTLLNERAAIRNNEMLS